MNKRNKRQIMYAHYKIIETLIYIYIYTYIMKKYKGRTVCWGEVQEVTL